MRRGSGFFLFRRRVVSPLILCALLIFPACFPMIFVGQNSNAGDEESDPAQLKRDLATFAGRVELPARLSPTLASIRADLSGFKGFSASLQDETGWEIGRSEVQADGTFRFDPVRAGIAQEIKVTSHRLELMTRVEHPVLAGQTGVLTVDVRTTARALVYRALRTRDLGFTLAHVADTSVAMVENALLEALGRDNNDFSHSTQTVLDLPGVVAAREYCVQSLVNQFFGR